MFKEVGLEKEAFKRSDVSLDGRTMRSDAASLTNQDVKESLGLPCRHVTRPLPTHTHMCTCSICKSRYVFRTCTCVTVPASHGRRASTNDLRHYRSADRESPPNPTKWNSIAAAMQISGFALLMAMRARVR